MIEESAEVRAVNGNTIDVVTVKSSACNQCDESAHCSTSVLSKFFGNKEIELQLKSDIPLKPGDQVLIGIEERVLIILTTLVYFVPLCGLFVFALLGGFMESYWQLETELLSIILGMAGLIAGYFGIRVLMEKKINSKNIKPVILKKL